MTRLRESLCRELMGRRATHRHSNVEMLFVRRLPLLALHPLLASPILGLGAIMRLHTLRQPRHATRTFLIVRIGVDRLASCVNLPSRMTTLSCRIRQLLRVFSKVKTQHQHQCSNMSLTFRANTPNYHPREDRAGLRLSGDNAQAVLPPNACVFVAKYVKGISKTAAADFFAA